MNKPPAFQFYADDFLAGTITMTNEERGLYISLLCRQWSQGHVTMDEIARLCPAMAQPSLDHVLAKFKKGADGHFRNERLESERSKQEAFRVNRSESGKLGAKTRWHSHSTAIAQPMAKHSSPSPSPSPSEIKKAAFTKPTIDEVRLLAQKAGMPQVEADKFFYHYDSKGWLVGKSQMRSLSSAIGGWATRWRAGTQSNGHASKPQPVEREGWAGFQ